MIGHMFELQINPQYRHRLFGHKVTNSRSSTNLYQSLSLQGKSFGGGPSSICLGDERPLQRASCFNVPCLPIRSVSLLWGSTSRCKNWKTKTPLQGKHKLMVYHIRVWRKLQNLQQRPLSSYYHRVGFRNGWITQQPAKNPSPSMSELMNQETVKECKNIKKCDSVLRVIASLLLTVLNCKKLRLFPQSHVSSSDNALFANTSKSWIHISVLLTSFLTREQALLAFNW